MRNSLLPCLPHFALALGLLSGADRIDAAGPLTSPPLLVSVDPRVELMSIVFRLAGNPEYSQGRVPLYLGEVESHFASFKEHDVITLARRLRQSRGISYDAVMSYAVHLTPQWEPALPFAPLPETLDKRWRSSDAKEFLEKLANFAQVTHFQAFISAHETSYQQAVAGMAAVLQHADLGWFDRFFGARPGARFRVVLGMLNGGACYGARIQRPGEPEDLYCILGVWAIDILGRPKFDQSMIPTVAHEFCHSYVNPLVHAHEKDLRTAGDLIYPAVAQAMRNQAYGNWLTMLHESLVRASVIRYQAATEGEAVVEKAVREQVVERSFLWMPELVKLLGDYESHRDQYTDFATFFPRVIAFFNDYAPTLARRIKEQEEATPKVLSMIPASGSREVDPGLSTITVTFDRPMQGSYSFVGGGPLFPETTGKPAYDATRCIVTLPVKLTADHDYEFWLNRNQFQGFRSDQGIPLDSVHVRFRTGPPR